jgi:hypothetical protein
VCPWVIGPGPTIPLYDKAFSVSYKLTIKAHDLNGSVVSEATYEAPTKEAADDFAEEWTDRLTRRGVPHVYVSRDYGTGHWMPDRGLYLGLFGAHPEAYSPSH